MYVVLQTNDNVKLVYELRSLFAVMATSKMKHVDPKKHIQVIKKVFAARGAESQQVCNIARC